ncbi:MAG: hypothetical protein ACFCAD_18460 [Pleurocapsa sp.]
MESICQALYDLLICKIVIQKETIGEAKKIGKVTKWLKKPQAAIAKITDASLKISSNVFLVNENNAYCQSAVVQSIQINSKAVDEIEATNEIEIGLKFDINTRSGLNLYIFI